MNRREANQKLFSLALGLAAPMVVSGCSKSPDCSNVSNLSADDLRVRNETAKYVEQSPEAGKKCAACALYAPAAEGQCGGCSVVKGPINPNGYCTLFVAKPT